MIICIPSESSSFEKIKLANGEMVYFGLKKGLMKQIKTGLNDDNSIISLKFNVDGIPVFRNSSLEFWPILVHSTMSFRNYPFVVGIFCGVGKPTPIEEFLNRFIDECLDVASKGIQYFEKTYNVTFSFFACDAPARAYLKRVMGHTSFGCERCTIEARREERKSFFPAQNTCRLRKDEDFCCIAFESENHIKEMNPLIKLNIGLVTQFVLDPMHLVYLGTTVRLLLLYLVEGKRSHKLSKLSISKINKQLLIVRKFTPIDFHRKIRSLHDLKRWKALEYRLFLNVLRSDCVEK